MDDSLAFWAVAMLLTGGLFTGAAFAMSWGLAPIWQKLPVAQFKSQFAKNTRIADIIQPLFLVTVIVSAVGYAAACHGMGVTLSTYAAAGYILVLLFSALYMIPLQRKMAAFKDSGLPAMRTKWINGHHIRTIAAMVSFALSIGAVAVHL